MKLNNLLINFGFFFIICFLSFMLLSNLSADTNIILYGLENTQLKTQSESNLALFFQWIIQICQGNFGQSNYHKVAIIQLILPAVKTSFILILLSLLITLIITIALVSAFILAKSKIRTLLKTLLNSLIIVPNYIITLCFIILFCLIFKLFPLANPAHTPSFLITLKYLFLPALSIATCQSVMLSKLIIQNFLIEIKKQYPTTSKAKGNKHERTITKHILINSLYPLANHFTLLINSFLSSTLIIEIIFNIKGLNFTFFEAAQNRDTPLLMTCLLIFYLIIMSTQILNDWFQSKQISA